MELPLGDPPAKGLRAWTTAGLKSHGLNKANVAPHMGGDIFFQSDADDIFAVRWDSGETTVHCVCDFPRKLVCIGSHQNLDDYVEDKKNGEA